jgi:dipeptidyl aminopeptidase/acylaminoacyl peptidase
MSNPLDLELLLRVPYVDPDLGFDISPSGSKTAFSWNLSGRWEIYILDLVGKTTPQKVTNGEGAKFAPRWSPDGVQLAYILDPDGSENYDIYSINLESGEHRNLTPGTPDAILPGYDWSPDGKSLAFCSNRAGRFDTYLMPAAGGQARKVLDLPHSDDKVHWSPDGRQLAVVAEGAGQDYWIYLVPLDGGKPYPIVIDGKPIPAKDACWSPDSRRLAFSSNLHGNFEIGIYDIDTGSIIRVTDGEGEKESPDWSSRGQLSYVISHGPRTELVIQTLQTGEVTIVQNESGVIYSPKFDPQGEQILFVFDNPHHPDDLWSYSFSDRSFKQITRSLPDTVDRSTLIIPEEIRYPGLDGAEVPALLYRPSIIDELPPAVLYIHGGPNWLTQITWDPLIQHMVSRGWVVLAPNYRGSTGFGREWQLASRFDFGGVDTADVLAGSDFLIDNEIADAKKIAVTGRSWGGYLTMTCLTQYPERWAAGSAVVPFLNWFTGHANSREDLQHWDLENFGEPERDQKLWHDRSPFFFLDRIQAPVQLICGAHDVRCPESESTQAYEQLTTLGKECEYILYPDEGHSFLKVKNQVKSKQQQVNFLARYLEERS